MHNTFEAFPVGGVRGVGVGEDGERGGKEGVLVPLFPLNISAFSLVHPNQNLNFLCSLLPKITFDPLFPSFLDVFP